MRRQETEDSSEGGPRTMEASGMLTFTNDIYKNTLLLFTDYEKMRYLSLSKGT